MELGVDRRDIKVKKFLKLICFASIAGAIILNVYNIISWKDTTGAYMSVTQQLAATDDDLIDAVFMGSSHCYCAVNPSQLWENYGISAFDMSISGADRESTYYSLVELLKTQSPEVVFIDLYALFYDGYYIKGNEYRNLLAMDTSMNNYNLIKAVAEEEEQMDYLLKWPIIHTRYKELTKYDFVQYEPSVFGRGFGPNPSIGWARKPVEAINCEWTCALNKTAKEWLDRLITLSEDEDFTLAFFVAPYDITAQEQKTINSVKEYVGEKKIDVIDFNKLWDNIKLDETTDFCDPNHTNNNGAKKITTYFGKYLNSKYELTDHRGDSDYYLWNECAIYEKRKMAAYEVGQIADIAEYLKAAMKLEDTTVVISFIGDYDSSTLDLSKIVESTLGIEEDAYLAGGQYIYENGELIYYLDAESDEEYVQDFKYDALCVRNSDGFDCVRVGNTNYGNLYNGINVVIYDDFLHQVVSQRGFY